MQTTLWAEFKSAFGWQNYGQYLVEADDGQALAAFSLLVRKKLGIKIFYIPRGPVFDENNKELTEFIFSSLRKIAGKERAFFMRISPAFLEENNLCKELLNKNKFFFSKKQLQTKATMIIDVRRGDDELLASFHKKTRYNIGLAERNGVTVTKLGDEKELQDFYVIMQKMAERQNYTLQSIEYYRYIQEKLVKEGIAEIYLAKNSESTIIGGIVVFSYAKRSYYMYGGFDYEYRSLMGNYLVHWQVMKEARARGDEYYDLQGIPLIKDESHPMFGFYRFKKGFNGEEIEFIGEFDYSPWPQKLFYKLWNNLKVDKELYLK